MIAQYSYIMDVAYAAIMQYIRLPEFGPQPPVESTFLSNQ